MSSISKIKSNYIAMSALVATSTFITHTAIAEDNPFAMTDLSSGYMVADSHGKHHKMKMMDTDGDGSVSKDEFMAHMEKKFAKKDKNGNGVLSGDEMKRMGKHHKCKKGEGKSGEGKCGEGKCGGKKSDS